MALHDFDQALAIHAALLAHLIAEPGGAANPPALARVTALCNAAVDAVNDVECRVAIRGVKSLASLLYSDDGHDGVVSGTLRGADAMRFQIMNALSAFRGRLEALERRRPSRPELPAIAPAKALRVLVVEDNRDSAETLAKLIELSGYSVSVAYTAMDGLEIAKRARPDVILCDIGLPDSDGFALAEALQANPLTAPARLIAITAYGQEADRERSRHAGFELHLVKPVSAAALLQVLEDPQKPNTAYTARVVELAAHKKPPNETGLDAR